ncbi:DUF3465 domain-containing protein [Thiobacillus sedimenti]|uniref:DUF3465 domain-containing protein n=1 Tax=Thiobacillus sedimenti TaxID=3110231 RepID=A0ABZ1CGU4_9PROT|nr:DUF3465 domain-containing protein [Thiobacillus sp. SCUT-2]WRS38467.1 DUF3465 domain-containing protein [Thiobacillus sp. SCUT-2]
MNRFLLLAALAAAAYFAWAPGAGTLPRSEPTPVTPGPSTSAAEGDAVLDRAFTQRLSRVQVAGEGTVARMLRDDRDGSRHQRFILRLASGRTVLVAHNIDLAPRLDALRVGDTVAFYGEYEWNPKGGVIHWTHRDPHGRHPDGWLRHDGRVYQ